MNICGFFFKNRQPGRQPLVCVSSQGPDSPVPDASGVFRSGKTSNFTFPMLGWSITFLIVAVIAGLFGFTGMAGTFTEIAKIFSTSYWCFS